jgi:hypothetical protein
MLGLTCRIDSSKAVQDSLYDQVGGGFFLPGRSVDNTRSEDRHSTETANTTVLQNG